MFPRFTKVLVVTDFSATADRAIPYAYSIVDVGGEVHLLHLLEHTEVPNPLYAHYAVDDLYNPRKRAKAIAEVEEHLRTLVPKTAGEKRVKTIVVATTAEGIAEGIVAEAHRRGVSAIVIGSHGRTGVSHLLMGSVAEQVLREAHLPVLVVPRQG